MVHSVALTSSRVNWVVLLRGRYRTRQVSPSRICEPGAEINISIKNRNNR